MVTLDSAREGWLQVRLWLLACESFVAMCERKVVPDTTFLSLQFILGVQVTPAVEPVGLRDH